MKRVFQWRRYLEWEGLSKHEKLAAKRLFFVPIAAYFVFAFINRHFITLIFLIGLFFVYKKLEKGKLLKWELSFLASSWSKRLTNQGEERLLVSSWTASKRSNWYDNYVVATTEKTFDSQNCRAAVRLKPGNGDLSQHGIVKCLLFIEEKLTHKIRQLLLSNIFHLFIVVSSIKTELAKGWFI